MSKERTIDSFSKEALVKYFQQRLFISEETIRDLAVIERRIQIDKIQTAVAVLLEKQRNLQGGITGWIEFLNISRRIDRMWKRQDKLFSAWSADGARQSQIQNQKSKITTVEGDKVDG